MVKEKINMEITIQRELREMSQIRKFIPNDMLEAYIDYAALYSKDCWLLFQDEFLRRMEMQISII